jgi:endonuclease-3
VKDKLSRVLDIIQCLRKTYPEVHCALDYANPLELLVATILSAQCTDERVNKVTPALFKKYKTARAYAQAKLEDIQDLIRSTGFYQNKAKNIQGAARVLAADFGGQVPQTMEALVNLPGVGRKTANVVLGNAFNIPGMPVDTHMIRVNNRLGLTRQKDPVKIETELTAIVPKQDWTIYSHLIIWHGRARCQARKPDCAGCEIRELCPKIGVPPSLCL